MAGRSISRKTEPRVCYLDSCVFLALINKMEGRLGIIGSILADAEKGDAVIHTSIMSRAEVAFAEDEKIGRALDSAVEERIDKLWHPSSPVNIIEVHPHIVKDAVRLNRELLATANKTVRGADSIHLATALSVGVGEFHTYDKKLLSIGSINRMKICEPNNDVMAFEETQ